MVSSNSTGANTSKLNIEDLGPINNLSDKLELQAILKGQPTWAAFTQTIFDTKIYMRVSANVIARVLLLAFIEQKTPPPMVRAPTLDEMKNAVGIVKPGNIIPVKEEVKNDQTSSGNQTSKPAQTIPPRSGPRNS